MLLLHEFISCFLSVAYFLVCVLVEETSVNVDNFQTPFTRYNRLSNGLYNRFDNRLYTRYSRFVKPVVKRV